MLASPRRQSGSRSVPGPVTGIGPYNLSGKLPPHLAMRGHLLPVGEGFGDYFFFRFSQNTLNLL